MEMVSKLYRDEVKSIRKSVKTLVNKELFDIGLFGSLVRIKNMINRIKFDVRDQRI